MALLSQCEHAELLLDFREGTPELFAKGGCETTSPLSGQEKHNRAAVANRLVSKIYCAASFG
jgi:hypothetical protein